MFSEFFSLCVTACFYNSNLLLITKLSSFSLELQYLWICHGRLFDKTDKDVGFHG